VIIIPTLMRTEQEKNKLKDYIVLAAYILIVVGLGVFATNQVFKFFYGVHLLKNPCHLCAELNSNQSLCIQDCFIIKQRVFPDGLGGWVLENGSPYRSPTSERSFAINISNLST